MWWTLTITDVGPDGGLLPQDTLHPCQCDSLHTFTYEVVGVEFTEFTHHIMPPDILETTTWGLAD